MRQRYKLRAMRLGLADIEARKPGPWVLPGSGSAAVGTVVFIAPAVVCRDAARGMPCLCRACVHAGGAAWLHRDQQSVSIVWLAGDWFGPKGRSSSLEGRVESARCCNPDRAVLARHPS